MWPGLLLPYALCQTASRRCANRTSNTARDRNITTVLNPPDQSSHRSASTTTASVSSRAGSIRSVAHCWIQGATVDLNGGSRCSIRSRW